MPPVRKRPSLIEPLVAGLGVLLFSMAACGTDTAAESGNASSSSSGGGSTSSGSGSSSGGTTSSSSSGDGGADAASNPLVGEVHKGIATFYDADGTGNCSFPASPQDLMVVAPNKGRWYAGSAACGSCLKVTGTKGVVVVRVVDSCPLDTPGNDCGDTGADLDLSAQAFAKIEDPSVGVANITFQVVPCDVKGPMQFQFKSGSSQYWVALQVRNHREPVAKMEWSNGGAWVDMPRSDDNFFEADKGVGEGATTVHVRVTSVYGQAVEETLPIDDSKLLTGTQQFQ